MNTHDTTLIDTYMTAISDALNCDVDPAIYISHAMCDADDVTYITVMRPYSFEVVVFTVNINANNDVVLNCVADGARM